jgi:2-C-methyl-D-erythritol 4-phosphate cytidylyltransferase/2-C-methyl-D-erythritol 2,4-cyclodiphosphate synthase
MQTAAIIVAAGRGTRAGSDLPKQWHLLAGRPVLAHAIEAFRTAGVAPILLVIHPDDVNRAGALKAADLRVVIGAATRDGSVKAGLAALQDKGVDCVLIHDGARPLVSAALVRRLAEALETHQAAAPALAITDALWRGANGRVVDAVAREGLFRAQTPQAFRLGAIVAAHAAHPGGAADDVAVARAAGIDVAILPGDEDNLKLTWPEDFARAARILAARGPAPAEPGPAAQPQEDAAMDIRLGNGFDVHAFGPGDHVWLCGVRIAHPLGLIGHSDADVGMHALTDAIYGALADGDIGRHFPPSDPQWRGAASEIFLRHAARRAAERGYRIANADVTLVCEAPRIGPHAAAMQASLARIIALDPDRISVKATTSERLGFTGRGEGIAALATAALVRGGA